MHGEGDSDLLLLPHPARLTRLGAAVRLPDRLMVEGVSPELASIALGERVEPSGGLPATIRANVETVLDDPRVSIDEQRYAMRIAPPDTPSGPIVRITAPSVTAGRHALHTLAQLIRRFGRRIPALMIEDRPAFAVRGAMLDVSRTRVPTMRHLLGVVDTLASLKINHLQLYTEHTFAYAGHEAVWAGCSPMTPAEVRRLDEHCKARGIELAANQNCFGHLTRWLNLEPYKHLAETHGDWTFDVWPRSGPFSLCPTDGASKAFVEGLLDQLVPCFTSNLVNIGCDETYDVGAGRSWLEVQKRGREAVYLDFVRSVAAMCRERRRRPMFWADIALHNPACLKDVPSDLLALAWGYEADAPFAEWLRLLRDAGREAWVCPGSSSWRTFAGRPSERTGNISAAIRAGLEHGAGGVLTCDWGDEGHRQQWPVSMVGLAHGAAASWNAAHAGGVPHRAIALHALHDASMQSAGWLEALGEIDAPIRAVGMGYSRPGKEGRLRNASATFADMSVALDVCTEVATLGMWREVADKLAAERVPSGLGPLLADQLQHALDVSRFAAARAVARRYKAGLPKASRQILAERLAGIIDEHRRLWLIDSRPGGLDESADHYRKRLDELNGAASAVAVSAGA